MKIFNVNVYGLEESIKASGYPMISEEIPEYEDIELTDRDDIRAGKLGNALPGSGHDSYLKGIIVQFDITYPQYWSMQFQRYHFADIVSSTSKMHRLTKMDIENCCNKYVDECVIENLNSWIDIYNKPDTDAEDKYFIYMKIISNTPMGLKQTMRVTTNYLQLKTIYNQRRYHKLKEDWGYFCDWIESLPKFNEIALNVK